MPDPANPKTWTPDYAWKLFDQVLLMAKVSEIANEMQRKMQKAKATAAFEGRKKGNAAYYLSERIRREEEGADEWAEKYYQAALNVWQTQGHPLCRAFFLAVYARLLASLFAARTSTVCHDLISADQRTGRVGHSQAHTGSFTRAMNRLKSKWNTKMEVAARENEYKEQRRKKAIAEADRPSLVRDSEFHRGIGIIEGPGFTIYGVDPEGTGYVAQERKTGAYLIKPTRDSVIFDDTLLPIGSVQELLYRPKKRREDPTASSEPAATAQMPLGVRAQDGSLFRAEGRYIPNTVRRDARKLNTQDRYKGWQMAYRSLKKSNPNMSDVWYSQQIAKMEVADGRDASTIRKHMLK